MNKILLLLTFIAINTTVFTQPISAQEAYIKGIIGGLAATQVGTIGEKRTASNTSPRANSLKTRHIVRAHAAEKNPKIKSPFYRK